MGIDIDQFDAGTGYGISPNDSSVVLQFGTKADRYFPGLFTFTAKMKDTSIKESNPIINPENGPLPVTMISFTGILLQDNKVKLDWSTLMEINCTEYKIERSVDGKVFYEVAAVEGNGTTTSKHSYLITDNISSVKSSIVYYRLKQIDVDKNAGYSKIIAVTLKNLREQINIYPNPFADYLNINIEWSRNEIINVKVISIKGEKVISKNIQVNKGLNYFAIEELSALSSGSYYMQFISSSDIITKKIIKQ